MKNHKTNSMAGIEIINRLKELGLKPEHLAGYSLKNPNELFISIYDKLRKDVTEKYLDIYCVIDSEFGNWEEKEQEGGEGEGDHYHVVWYFANHDVYIKGDAYYSSMDGVDWSYATFYEVRPIQKTITVYE